MHLAPRNKGRTARPDFVPFRVLEKCYLTFKDVKGLVVVDVKVQRRPSFRRGSFQPHRLPAAGLFAIEQDDHFFPESAQDTSLFRLDNDGRFVSHLLGHLIKILDV